MGLVKVVSFARISLMLEVLRVGQLYRNSWDWKIVVLLPRWSLSGVPRYYPFSGVATNQDT